MGLLANQLRLELGLDPEHPVVVFLGKRGKFYYYLLALIGLSVR